MITSLAPEDLPRILEIERQSYPRPWSERMFLQEFANPLGISFGFRRGKLLGYVFAWMIFEDLHINNIAVDPSERRSGIGSALLQATIDAAKRQGGGHATLEVRSSNITAAALYAKFGFAPVASRLGYYEDTGEDAIVMGMKISK